MQRTPRDDFAATEMYRLAWIGDVTGLAALLEKGHHPDLMSQGETALHKASWENKTDVVRLLLEKGAAPDTPSAKKLHTALHKSAARGHVQVTELLLKAGASVAARNAYGNTPLHEAAAGGSIEVVALLLAAGADPRAINHLGGGLTPAQFARHMKQEKCAVFLEQEQRLPPSAIQKRHP